MNTLRIFYDIISPQTKFSFVLIILAEELLKKRIAIFLGFILFFENEIKVWFKVIAIILFFLVPGVRSVYAEEIKIDKCDEACRLFVQEMMNKKRGNIETRKEAEVEISSTPVQQFSKSSKTYQLPMVKITVIEKIPYIMFTFQK